MKKIGIFTINDNNNYGNRLQNYALQNVLICKNYDVTTLKNDSLTNLKKLDWNQIISRKIKKIIKSIFKIKQIPKGRKRRFNEFNKNIKFSSKNITYKSDISSFDFIIVGSDQVWNPNFERLRDLDLLNFKQEVNKISFSASFGTNDIPIGKKGKVSNELKKFKAISVREDRGKEIVEELTGRTDVEVLVDPTMLLTAEEWDKVSKKPEQLKSDKKYILNYFLGNLSDKRKSEIERIAKENDCEIINILDKENPFYETGPSEFLYLEKNAFLICTDSFHSCVFAILYNRPFIIFEREENTASMNSRIETLLAKFELKNRTFKGKITKENLEHDYSKAYKILQTERKKSNMFLEKALS